jgi:capsular exopolysaccharide synthesis family protein
MDVASVAAVLRARWQLVVVAPLVAAGIALFASLGDAPSYEATATLRVTSRAALLGSTVRPDDLTYLDRLYNTYERIGTTDQLIQQVRTELRVDGSLGVSVRARPSTELMEATARSADERAAVGAANRVATLLVQRVQTMSSQGLGAVDATFDRRISRLLSDVAQLRRQRAERTAAQAPPATLTELDARIRALESTIVQLRASFEENRLARLAQGQTMSILEAARPPARSIGRSLVGKLIVALLLGGLAGVALPLAIERLRRSPRTAGELHDRLGATVLGAIPRVRLDPFAELPEASIFMNDNARDAARRLAAITAARTGEQEIKSISIVSAESGEGKSVASVMLARALAESGKRVVLIDGDARASRIHAFFGLPNTAGLSGLVQSNRRSVGKALRPTSVPGLFVLPSGATSPSTTADMSARLGDIIAQTAEAYDMVVIDTPAVLRDAAALHYVSITDATILVVGERTSWEIIDEVVGQLESMNALLLGVVTNAWTEADSRPFYGARPKPSDQDVNTTGTSQVDADLTPLAAAGVPEGERFAEGPPPAQWRIVAASVGRTEVGKDGDQR